MALVISIPMGILFGGNHFDIGYSLLLVAAAIHYWVYEFRNPQQYYFYYNLGLSRFKLWLSTLGLGLLTTLLAAIL